MVWRRQVGQGVSLTCMSCASFCHCCSTCVLFHLFDNYTWRFRCCVNWLTLTQWYGAWFKLVMVSYKGLPCSRLNAVVNPLSGSKVVRPNVFPSKLPGFRRSQTAYLVSNGYQFYDLYHRKHIAVF